MPPPAPLLAFPIWMHGPQFGSHIEGSEAMDLFALLTLGFLFFVLGVIATWAWMLWRRSVRPTPHEQLLMEIHHHDHDSHEETPAPAADAPPAGEPWEKSADWWKKDR